MRRWSEPMARAGASGTTSTAGTSSTSRARWARDRKSTRLNSSHTVISYAVCCWKKKKLWTSRRRVWLQDGQLPLPTPVDVVDLYSKRLLFRLHSARSDGQKSDLVPARLYGFARS